MDKLSFPKNIDKNLSTNLNDKDRQNFLDHFKKSATNLLKTTL